MSKLSSLVAAATLLVGAQLHAAPIFHVAEDILPGGLATLQAERGVWSAAFGGLLQTEGFEGLGAAPASGTDFGDFTLTFTAGPLTLFGANALVRTEGVQGLGFSGGNTLIFTFDNPINAFGIDWSSFDSAGTVIAYSDDAGGAVGDVFIPMTSAGAGFFGVRNTTAFTTVTFTVTSNEILEFDNIQWGANEIPEPSSIILLGMGALGAFGSGWRRKRKTELSAA